MPDQKNGEPAPKIRLHYIKSSSCVDLVVHGGYGGLNTGNGRLHLAVYSERLPIPKELVVEVKPDGEEMPIERIGKDGVIRSVEAVLHFDIATAVSLHQWLNDKIEAFQKVHPEVFASEDEEGD